MSQSDVPKGLDNASQKHENEIVIELAPDRILHYVGVYLVVLLAVVTKISEVTTGQNVACYPIHQNKSDFQFIKYANAYCWTTSSTDQQQIVKTGRIASACKQETGNATAGKNSLFLQESDGIRTLIQCMPYAMLLEAFVFALPMAYWHFTVGARLMGHLKFVQLLLQDIYESVKTIPAGIYRKEAYDKDGESLNGWRTKSKPKESTSPAQSKTVQEQDEQQVPALEQTKREQERGEQQGKKRKLVKKRATVEAEVHKDAKKSGYETTEFGAQTCDEQEENTSLIKKSSKRRQKEAVVPSPSTGKIDKRMKGKKQSEMTAQSLKKEKIVPTAKNISNKSGGSSANDDADAHSTEGADSKENIVPDRQLRANKDTSDRKVLEDMLIKTTKPEFVKGEEGKKDNASAQGSKSGVSSANDDAGAHSTEGVDPKEKTVRDVKDALEIITEPEFGKEGGSNKIKREEGKKDNVHAQGSEKTDDKMRDRHIFSMLCYENFASLQHQPYLKSIQKLTSVPSFEENLENEDDEEKILPLKHAILRQYCHQENFKSRFLFHTYIKKCLLSIILSSFFFVGITALFVVVVLPTVYNNAFTCDIPYHKCCLSCTLTDLVNFYAAFFANWLAVFINLIVASAQLHFVCNGLTRAVCYFLEDIKPLCGVALMAAHVAGNNKKS